MTIQQYFQNIATAIKQKNSQIVTVTPAQMPQAILDIPSSGGGLSPLEPLHFDFSKGYLNNNVYIPYNVENSPYRHDIYEIDLNRYYVIFMGVPFSNPFVVAMFNDDPTTYTRNTSGELVIRVNSAQMNNTATRFLSDKPYLFITKTISSVSELKSYVIDVTELYGGN